MVLAYFWILTPILELLLLCDNNSPEDITVFYNLGLFFLLPQKPKLNHKFLIDEKNSKGLVSLAPANA